MTWLPISRIKSSRFNSYLRTVNRVVEEELVTLPSAGKSNPPHTMHSTPYTLTFTLLITGELDIFPHMKKLVHKIGFLSWVGEDALQVPLPYFERNTFISRPTQDSCRETI